MEMQDERGARLARSLVKAGAWVWRASISAGLILLVIFFMAGLPLLVSEQSGRLVFAPQKIPLAAWNFVASALDGSVFTYTAGYTAWDFRELAPKFLWVSFMYTAFPGGLGIGLGTFLGAAHRSRRRGGLDRASDVALATPDFLVILVIQLGASWIMEATGIKIAPGATGTRLALLPFLVMSIYPFFLSYRAAAEASRRAEGEEYIVYARAKGLPERDIVRRHLGAALIPRLEAELPVIIAFMQGSLFLTEKTFALPGMARLFFDSAFAGRRSLVLRAIYQYDHVVLSLLGLVLSCVAVYAVLRLSLAVARKALTRE